MIVIINVLIIMLILMLRFGSRVSEIVDLIIMFILKLRFLFYVYFTKKLYLGIRILIKKYLLFVSIMIHD